MCFDTEMTASQRLVAESRHMGVEVKVAADKLDELEAENAKLRELCAEMFADLDGVIGEDDTIVANRGWSRWLLDESDVDAYRNRMRELGIEVDE